MVPVGLREFQRLGDTGRVHEPEVQRHTPEAVASEHEGPGHEPDSDGRPPWAASQAAQAMGLLHRSKLPRHPSGFRKYHPAGARCVSGLTVSFARFRIASPHLPMHRLRSCHALRRLIGVALLSLLVGQGVVLTHAIEHARAQAAVAGSAEPDHAWGHQAGTSACHLVDHLLTGQAPGGEPATAPCLPAAALRLVAPAPSLSPGLASRAYEARGPPRA
jgi:hypothetical protein